MIDSYIYVNIMFMFDWRHRHSSLQSLIISLIAKSMHREVVQIIISSTTYTKPLTSILTVLIWNIRVSKGGTIYNGWTLAVATGQGVIIYTAFRRCQRMLDLSPKPTRSNLHIALCRSLQVFGIGGWLPSNATAVEAVRVRSKKTTLMMIALIYISTFLRIKIVTDTSSCS